MASRAWAWAPLGHLLHGHDHLAGARRHLKRGLAHVGEEVADLLDHDVDGVHHAAEHVGGHLAALGEVALGDLHGGVEEARMLRCSSSRLRRSSSRSASV